MGTHPHEDALPAPLPAGWPCQAGCGFTVMGIREVLRRITQLGKSGPLQVTHGHEVTLVSAEPKQPEQMPS